MWSHPKDSPFLPHSSIQAFERKVDGTDEDTGLTVGHLLFRLGDIGVIAEHLTSSRQLKAGLTFAARYDRNVYFITPKNEFRIRGIFLTPLGDSIARFYEPQWNPPAVRLPQTGSRVSQDSRLMSKKSILTRSRRDLTRPEGPAGTSSVSLADVDSKVAWHFGRWRGT